MHILKIYISSAWAAAISLVIFYAAIPQTVHSQQNHTEDISSPPEDPILAPSPSKIDASPNQNMKPHEIGLPLKSQYPNNRENAYLPFGPKGIRLALTLRGGASLGAFEAGYLYYLSESVKTNPGFYDTRVVTGASAGSINALLLAISLGSEQEPNPQDSLFYRVWSTLSFKNLFDTSNPDTIRGSFSSGRELNRIAEMVWQQWQQGLDESFEIILGVSATRMDPYDIEVVPGLTVKRQAEKFVIKIKGRGKGIAPLVTNHVYANKGLFQPLLPFKTCSNKCSAGESVATDRHNYELIRDVVFASAAVPIAFEPQTISYCMGTVGDEHDSTECKNPTHKGRFIDGGVFDNNPLRLAHQIAASLSRNRSPESNTVSGKQFAEDYLFVYLDPDHSSYPSIPTKSKDTSAHSQGKEHEGLDILKFIPRFLGNFIQSARSAEMFAFIEEHPEAQNHVKLTTRDYPTISAEMGAFLGFLDREFLKYDFYLGMHSAYNYIVDKVYPHILEHEDNPNQDLLKNAVAPEPNTTPSNKLSYQWRPYYCMKFWFDNEPKWKTACDLPETNTASPSTRLNMRDFKILMQISMDKLYQHCSKLPIQPTDHYHCRMAMNHPDKSPPLLDGVTPVTSENSWRQCTVCELKTNQRCTRSIAQTQSCMCKCYGKRNSEGDFSYTMRRLAELQFHFKDLGLARHEADRGILAIKNNMLRLLDEFSQKQERNRRLTLKTIGKPALNFLGYTPPPSIFYLMIGNGIEFSWSGTSKQAFWMRFNTTLFEVEGLHNLISGSKVATFTPAVGVEFELLPLSSPLFQSRFSVRAGYQLSTSGGFSADSCKAITDGKPRANCSYMVFQGIYAFSFYERVRLNMGIEWAPPLSDKLPPKNNHWFSTIIAIGWQWI